MLQFWIDIILKRAGLSKGGFTYLITYLFSTVTFLYLW